jgi:catechol 2,3-dioxygenase-like lactoylglutathione lyase family enzyme
MGAMEAVEVLGVEHIDVTVNDLARSTAFYDKVMLALGFKRLPDNDRNNIRWANAHISFAIRPAAASERGTSHNRYRVGLHHLAFKAKSSAAIDEFLADPDGMKLELVHFPWGYWRATQSAGSDSRARS